MKDKFTKIKHMYTTGRQFKNAILEEEMIVLPYGTFGYGDGVLDIKCCKITIGGKKYINRVIPYVVNKSFACELFLKTILELQGQNIKKEHSLYTLLMVSNCIKEFQNYLKERGFETEIESLENKIKKISNVFLEWRYIYEKETAFVYYGFVDDFCDFLDEKCVKMIKDTFNYDIGKSYL